MMRRLMIGVALTFALGACDRSQDSTPTEAETAPVPTAEVRFAELSEQALQSWFSHSPVSATQIGDHSHDAELDDLSGAGRAAALQASQSLLAELDTIDTTALGREDQVDAAILRNQLQYEIWSTQVLQSWAWDPTLYNQLAGGALYGLMAREFAPLPQRLKAATARMEQIPGLLAQARQNLDPARVPKIHAETVARQNPGLMSIVEMFIAPHIDELPGEDAVRLRAAIDGLQAAVTEHQQWLEQTLVPNAAGDFRLGVEKYDQKLRFALSSSLSRDEIKRRAQAEITRGRAQMYAVARTVLQGRPNAPALPATPSEEQLQTAVEAALELANVEHAQRGELVAEAKAALASSTEFVRTHDLVTLPDSPVKIILMPEFQRGVAVAYCDSPGPLDKGLDTFYAVSPVPEDWNDEQVESFLREYNSRMIHLLSIHEGTPGHYLEGWHSAKFPSTLRGVLRSGLFAEGWAVYTERMMADAGYLADDPLFRLMQIKFYLRGVANAILDQGVHVDGWSREQAMDLMVRQTFQQESEAAGKWVRAQLTSAQLPTYFVGAQEHFDLREAMQAKLGDDFDLKAYHDQVLSYGAPPVRYVRELMLDQPIE